MKHNTFLDPVSPFFGVIVASLIPSGIIIYIISGLYHTQDGASTTHHVVSSSVYRPIHTLHQQDKLNSSIKTVEHEFYWMLIILV